MSEELDGTLSNLFEKMYRTHRLCGKSPETVRNYRINIRHLEKILGRTALVTDLSDETILGAMQWMLDHGSAVATANKLRIHLCSLWNFAARKGLTKCFPDVQPLRAPQRIPQAWSRTQLQTLFAALSNAKGRIGGLPANDWLFTQHLFFWETAERLNAQLTQRVDDIDLDTGWCLVRAEQRKGCTRDRKYRLKPGTLARLRRLIELDPDRELVWPLTISRGALWHRYKTILRDAGLPTTRASMFHRMRRSALSHFRAAGGNATRLADHSSDKITRDSYEDPTIVVDVQASDLLFDPYLKIVEDFVAEIDSDPPRAA